MRMIAIRGRDKTRYHEARRQLANTILLLQRVTEFY